MTNENNTNNKGEFIITKEALELAFDPLLHIENDILWMFSIDFNFKTKATKAVFTDIAEVSLTAPFKLQSIKSMPVILENDDEKGDVTTIFLIELPAEEKNHYNTRSVSMFKVLLKMNFQVARISFKKEFHAGKISRYYMNIKTDTGYVLQIKTLPVI